MYPSNVSIIIPVKPGNYVAAIDALNKYDNKDISYEILLAEGFAPSTQRNESAIVAAGDILYFLDDDSLVDKKNLKMCCEMLRNSENAIVGGPSLTNENDSYLQKSFGAALSSYFGAGKSFSRYISTGCIRETSDSELILCNMAIKRDVFIKLGGFNESLYPNEENEFIERVLAAGYKVIYHPDLKIWRSQRKTFSAFVKQMYGYGRGRGRQSRLTGRYPIVSFIPMFFLIYLIIVLFLTKYTIILLPLVIYCLLSVCYSVFNSVKHSIRTGLILCLIYPIMHISNGIGLLSGLLSRIDKQYVKQPVKITKVK